MAQNPWRSHTGGGFRSPSLQWASGSEVRVLKWFEEVNIPLTGQAACSGLSELKLHLNHKRGDLRKGC